VILYNTIVGLAAVVGLLLVAQLLKQFAKGDKVLGLLMNTSDSM